LCLQLFPFDTNRALEALEGGFAEQTKMLEQELKKLKTILEGKS